MKGELKNASFEGKEKVKIPKDATIVKNEFRITVEEIENGYIIKKNYDIKWKDKKGETHYEYFNKKWFSEENPLKIDEKAMPDGEGFLADNFE